MSVTAHPKPLPPARPPLERLVERPLEWKWLALTLATLLAAYLSMLNRYWVPSGDGEVYTCIARSLVQVHRLLFNGAKAAIAPPGWPLVLSWLMRISPEFWFLKLAILLSMVGGFASAFFIVRRFVSDRAAAGIIILTGLLSSVYPLTYWTHTESFFCLLGFAAILIAFRISEGRARLWLEVPLMLALLGFGSFTRWPGVLHAVLVIPILFSGAKRRPWERRSAWTYAALILFVCGGTLFFTHSYLRLSKAEQLIANASGGTPENETGEEVAMQSQMLTTMPSTTEPGIGSELTPPGFGDVMTQSKRGPVAEIFYRIGTAGRWFSWLLWQPTRFGQSVGLIDSASLLFGWLSIALLFVTTIRAVQRRDFFWVGLAIYTGGLCVIWPNPNARYFVPVAPFIVLGVLRGIRELSSVARERAANQTLARGSIASEAMPIATLKYGSLRHPRLGPVLPPLDMGRLHPACRGLAALFVVVTLLINLPLLAIDISVFRSPNFYERYEAGANIGLLEIAAYVKSHPLPAGELTAVYERYENMGRQRYSKFGIRAMHLLCNMQIIPVERKTKFLKQDPADEDFRRSIRRDGGSYVIIQLPWTPWRVWHFRLTHELQQWLTKKPLGTDSGGWELWVRFGARYHRSPDVPHTYTAPTRVPGL